MTGASISAYAPGSRRWELDALGNWSKLRTDQDADGAFNGGADALQSREHNFVNELVSVGGVGGLPLSYDNAGNLLKRQVSGDGRQEFTHDAWNRLVKAELVTISTGQRRTLSESEYNGLSWRTVHRADRSSPQDGVLEHARVMYYDAGWRLVEERVDPDAAAGGDERVAQTVWGTRYIDDAVLRRWRLASKSWPGAAGTGTASDGGTWWYCTDAQFSPVALVAASGAVAERVRYDAYGNARHHHGTDADGDGDADGADFDLITALIGGGDVPITNTLKYRSELDVNRDGVIDADDGQIVKKAALAALPEGEVSAGAGPDSPVGYCGYLFNAETQLYTVRFRWYSPALGRWISRDPLGYVDGMGLYEYGQGSPVGALDPMGLSVAGGLADRLSGGGASTEQLQASRDDGCGKIRQAYLEGTICKKKFDHMWKTFKCGGSVAGEILGAAAEGFVEGAIDGVILQANNLTLGLALSETAEIIRDANSNNSWYTAGDWIGWVGATVLHTALPITGALRSVATALARLPAGHAYLFYSGAGKLSATALAAVGRGGLVNSTRAGRFAAWVEFKAGQGFFSRVAWDWASRGFANAAARSGAPIMSFLSYQGRVYSTIERPILRRTGRLIEQWVDDTGVLRSLLH